MSSSSNTTNSFFFVGNDACVSISENSGCLHPAYNLELTLSQAMAHAMGFLVTPAAAPAPTADHQQPPTSRSWRPLTTTTSPPAILAVVSAKNDIANQIVPARAEYA